MPKFTKQQLEEQYNKLPKALTDALFSAEIANKMFEIGKKNSLTIEEVGRVAEETGHVILGLTRPENFKHELEELLKIDEEEAQKIAGEVNKEVFLPLREALKAAHQMEITDEEIAKTEVAVKPPTLPATQPQPPRVTALPPQPKAEAVPLPRPAPQPIFTKPPEQERKTIQPLDLRPKPTPPPEPKFFEKFAAQKVVPLSPSEAVAKEGKAPPPHKATTGKAERMREAIFAPPIEPQAPAPPKETPPVVKPPELQPEKKTPYKGYDPYKEPAE